MADLNEEALNKRFREKMVARGEGRTPVFETLPAIDTSGTSPAAIEERFRAKLARHGRPVPVEQAAAEPKRKPKPESESAVEAKKAEQAAAEPKRGGG